MEWGTHSTPLPSASNSHEQTDMEPFQLDMNHLQPLDRYLRPRRGTAIGPRKAGSPQALGTEVCPWKGSTGLELLCSLSGAACRACTVIRLWRTLMQSAWWIIQQ